MLATVVKASKPTPRGVGSVLAIHADGQRFIGSVSAGCVEHEVIECARLCLEDGVPRWLKFGPGEGFPWEVELSCGGTIEVRVEPAPHLRSGSSATFVNGLVEALDDHVPCVWRSDGQVDSLGPFSEDSPETYETVEGERRVLYRFLGHRKRLFVVGASHIALHLVAAAKMLQYEVVVIDPRASYAREERFQSRPDELCVQWPDAALERFRIGSSDALVVITHDPKIDDRALAAALRTSCGYIGALGSKRSHRARLKRLGRLGFGDDELARIFGPVGIDIGSKTPAEIAVSVVAQLIQERNRESR